MRRAERAAVQGIKNCHPQDADDPQRARLGRAAHVQHPNQRREQVQPHDHVQIPEVVVGLALRNLARPERKIDAAVVPPVQARAPCQVEQRPEQERGADPREAPAVEAPRILRLVGIEQQRAAHHHKDRHAPARGGVIQIGGQPCAAAVSGGIADDQSGAVQQNDGQRSQPAG